MRKVDRIYIEETRKAGLYDAIWQAYAVLLPVRSVGVQGDARSYDQVVALRAVTSTDGMTAESYAFPQELRRHPPRQRGPRGGARLLRRDLQATGDHCAGMIQVRPRVSRSIRCRATSV